MEKVEFVSDFKWTKDLLNFVTSPAPPLRLC